MRIVSARLSPLDAELEPASANPRQLPPKRSMAASKLKRVRVLGSKNNVARSFPLQLVRRYFSSFSIFSANENKDSISLSEKSSGSTNDRPFNISPPTEIYRYQRVSKTVICD
jgi:hypothetical protein